MSFTGMLQGLDRLGLAPAITPRVSQLTLREPEVPRQLAGGPSTSEVAPVMLIGAKAVSRRDLRMLDKLGIRDRVALVRYVVLGGIATHEAHCSTAVRPHMSLALERGSILSHPVR